MFRNPDKWINLPGIANPSAMAAWWQLKVIQIQTWPCRSDRLGHGTGAAMTLIQCSPSIGTKAAPTFQLRLETLSWRSDRTKRNLGLDHDDLCHGRGREVTFPRNSMVTEHWMETKSTPFDLLFSRLKLCKSTTKCKSKVYFYAVSSLKYHIGCESPPMPPSAHMVGYSWHLFAVDSYHRQDHISVSADCLLMSAFLAANINSRVTKHRIK